VARAQIVQITQQQPFLKAVRSEISDKIPPNLELPNLLAANIENLMLVLSSMEHRLAQATQESTENDEDGKGKAASTLDEQDREMQRRIAIAKLVRSARACVRALRFSLEGKQVGICDCGYQSLQLHARCCAPRASTLFPGCCKIYDNDQEDRFYEDEEGVDDDDDEEEFKSFDRRARFRRAYKVALSTDTQGYAVKAGGDSTVDRTPQELAAISWAAFCTEILPDADADTRILALDQSNLFDRLKIALNLLRQKKEQLKARMDKAGIKFRSDGGGEEDASSSAA
jgi:hypothetical protein